MSDEDLPYRRPLYALTTTLYFGAIGIIIAGFLLGPNPFLLLQYGGIAVVVSVPLAWWLSGRDAGFTGFPPSNLGFLLVIAVVAGVGFPAFGLLGMEDSLLTFLVLVVITLVLGRYAERETERRFGHLWGADVEKAPAEAPPAPESAPEQDDT